VEEAIEKTGGKMERGKDGTKVFNVGDWVKTGQGKTGVVADVRDDGRVVVEIGSIRLVVAPELLELVEGLSNVPPFHRSNGQ